MERDRPDILVVPPLAFFVAVAASLALHVWVPLGLLPAFPWLPRLIAGLVVFAAALAINISGILAFRRAGTNVNPYKPALKVVRGGIFRLTRNPMYLGLILFTAGLGLAFSNLWGLIAAALLWALLHWGVVLREERYMASKFGIPYRELIEKTRRWL